jgi:hypothetical protein
VTDSAETATEQVRAVVLAQLEALPPA